MGITGRYGQLFRSGSEKGTEIETILESLNEARGTAYKAYDDKDSYVSAENLAFAKAIAEIWSTNARMAAQFDPQAMGVFLSRWEEILGLSSEGLSLQQRKDVISAKMRLWTQEPTAPNVESLLTTILGNAFYRLEHVDADDDVGFISGGVTVPGGVTLPDGDFTSAAADVLVRVWKPKDKNDNSLIEDNEFEKLIGKAMSLLDNYLPAYCTFRYYYFVLSADGCVSGTQDSSTITGVGTNFNLLSPGDEIEIVSDNGNVFTYIVATVNSSVNLTIANVTIAETFSCSKYKTLGFILDYPGNLDTLPVA